MNLQVRNFHLILTLILHFFTLVNSISFAPYEFGLKLACASSDGKVSVLSYEEGGEWKCSESFPAHNSGCNSVAWCPSAIPSSLLALDFKAIDHESITLGPQRIATGGCDNCVKLWRLNAETGKWYLEDTLAGHSDWIRDVCWRPNIGLSGHLLVSCSQDNSVLLWRQVKGKWESKPLKPEPFPDTLWRVCFSEYGHLLAVSCGDNTVTLWKEIPDEGTWEVVGTVDENVTESVKISEPLAVLAPVAVPVPDIQFSSASGPGLKAMNDAGYIKPMSPMIPLMANTTPTTGYQQNNEEYDSYQHAQTPTFYQHETYENTTTYDQYPTQQQNYGYGSVNEQVHYTQDHLEFNKDIGFIPSSTSANANPATNDHHMYTQDSAEYGAYEAEYSTEQTQAYEQPIEQTQAYEQVYEQPVEQIYEQPVEQTYEQTNEQNQNYEQDQLIDQSYDQYTYEQQPEYSAEQTRTDEQYTEQTYEQPTDYNYNQTSEHNYDQAATNEYSYDQSADYQNYGQSAENQTYEQPAENHNYDQSAYGQDASNQTYEQPTQTYSYDQSTYQESSYQESYQPAAEAQNENTQGYTEYKPDQSYYEQYEQGSTETDYSAQALQYEGYQSATQSLDSYANQF